MVRNDQHNARKPRGSGGGLTKRAKRSSKKMDISGFSQEQQAILAQAASILGSSITTLPAVMDSVTSSSTVSSSKKFPGSKTPQARPSTHMQLPSENDRSPSDDYQTNVPTTEKEDGWRPSRSAPAANAALDLCSPGYFGFDMLPPSQWSDCFANLNFSPQLPQQLTFGDSYVHPSLSMNQSYSPMVPGPPATANRLQVNYQHVNVADDDLFADFFACDNLLAFEDNFEAPWQPSISHSQLQVQQPSSFGNIMQFPSSLNLGTWDLESQFFEPPLYDNTSSELENQLLGGCEPASHLEGLNQAAQESAGETAQSDEIFPTRRGPFKNQHDREKTAQTRKLTACMRCRIQRIRCIADPENPRGVCLTCKSMSFSRFSCLPCLRYKVTDVKMFKNDSGKVSGNQWTQRWSGTEPHIINDTDWASPEVRTLEITQDYTTRPIVIVVRKFVPQPGDQLHRRWVDGGIEKKAQIPPYAVANLETTIQTYKTYINEEGPAHFHSALNPADHLIWETYSMAIHTSNYTSSEPEKKLLKMVLRLWVATRINTTSERICGDETLGMSRDMIDKSSPMHKKIPIPPVLGAQLCYIVRDIIQIPLRRMILEQLQKVFIAHKPSTWFCVYLCTFMLLHNCSLITRQDIAEALKHGFKRRFARPEMITEYHGGANILLAHFHYCNKGWEPFTLNWDDKKAASRAELNDEQIQFMKRTSRFVKMNETRFNALHNSTNCDDDYYFVAQMFEKNWTPR